MNSDVIVLDNVVSDEAQSLIESGLTSINFPWNYYNNLLNVSKSLFFCSLM